MPLKLIKQAIDYLRKKSKCQFCGSRFTENSFLLVASTVITPDADGAGLFLVICPNCFAQASMMVETASVLGKLQQKSMQQSITANDVLDMHNFLKSWNGDVRELFKEI
ncbi:hypothetical protein HZA42_00100 [Candidatus Peregrinibacteria bacterium]|nr:hypothetical protein [Candidatus Peregrinibacteria bacterium]